MGCIGRYRFLVDKQTHREKIREECGKEITKERREIYLFFFYKSWLAWNVDYVSVQQKAKLAMKSAIYLPHYVGKLPGQDASRNCTLSLYLLKKQTHTDTQIVILTTLDTSPETKGLSLVPGVVLMCLDCVRCTSIISLASAVGIFKICFLPMCRVWLSCTLTPFLRLP